MREPSKYTRDTLAAILEDMAKRIRNNDSFEGSIQYSCLDDGLKPGTFNATGPYRVGNSEGQGGVRLLN
jgi:hypothetical protein